MHTVDKERKKAKFRSNIDCEHGFILGSHLKICINLALVGSSSILAR